MTDKTIDDLTSASGTVAADEIELWDVSAAATVKDTLTNALKALDPVTAARGGTGLTTYAVGDLIQASATTPTLAKLAAVATGSALISGGTNTVSSWGKIGLTTHVSGTLAEGSGGTNQTTYATGDLIQGTASNALGKLASVATGNALISGGVTTASTWGKIALTTHISGTLPVANGGTNLTSATAGDILYASATDVWSKLAKNTSSTRVLTNTGASNVPAWAQVDLTTGVTGVLPSANGGDRGLIAYIDGDATTTVSATPSDVSGLAVALVSGHRYSIFISFAFRTSVATGGLILGLTYPTQNWCAFEVSIPQGTDPSLGRNFGGKITGATSGSVTATAAPTANVTFIATIVGGIKVSASGNLQVQVGSEDGTSTITPKAGSHIIATQLD